MIHSSLEQNTSSTHKLHRSRVAGVVSGVNTASYVVATYINVAGGWWTKPYFNQPTVPINPDGTFTVETVTGGNDAEATEYELFVVPSTYAPPAAGGSYNIPTDVFSHAAAYTDVQRPPGFPGDVVTLPATRIESITITRSFNGPNGASDTVILTGTIPIVNTKIVGAALALSLGSNSWQFASVAKNGIAGVNGGSWQDSAGKITVAEQKTNWRFSAKLQCAPDNPVWGELGLVNATIMAPGIPIFMPVTITVNGQDYRKSISGYYTATEGKKGKLIGSLVGH